MLSVQIISGIFIGMHYVSDTAGAFDSIIAYTRNGSYGWAIRDLHANGASFFFAVVYINNFKGLIYC
jgi:ubiquinol-cytochrome c reductase cytochrome b subunit